MRATLFPWILVLFLLSGGLAGERLTESPVPHNGDEDSSSERHEAIKQAASRERTSRTPKTKWPRTALLAVTVWPPDRAFVDDRHLCFSPATPWNPKPQQFHQIFRI
jgi:hypothetical protein